MVLGGFGLLIKIDMLVSFPLIAYVWFILVILSFAWMFIKKIKDVLGFNSITLDEATKVACRLAEKKFLNCDSFAGADERSAVLTWESLRITTEEYLQNIEIYLNEACEEYAPNSTVSKQQAKEIARLSVYLEFETNYKTLLNACNSKQVDSYLRRKKEILKENSSSIFMTEQKAEKKAWEMARDDFPLPPPDIDISKLRELLTSCKDESLEKEAQEKL